MFDLYRQNLPCKKAYAVVSKGDKFLVLDTPAKKYKYQLAGGSVEAYEQSIDAILREKRKK